MEAPYLCNSHVPDNCPVSDDIDLAPVIGCCASCHEDILDGETHYNFGGTFICNDTACRARYHDDDDEEYKYYAF